MIEQVINGIIFRANPYGTISWCSNWEVVERFAKAGLIGRKFYRYLWGHTEYYLIDLI